MRIVLLAACQLVTACAPSTESIIREASQSNDWSAVHQRLDAEERQQALALSCPRGQTNLCIEDYGDTRCECVEDTVGRTMYRQMLAEQERMRSRRPNY